MILFMAGRIRDRAYADTRRNILCSRPPAPELAFDIERQPLPAYLFEHVRAVGRVNEKVLNEIRANQIFRRVASEHGGERGVDRDQAAIGRAAIKTVKRALENLAIAFLRFLDLLKELRIDDQVRGLRREDRHQSLVVLDEAPGLVHHFERAEGNLTGL